MIIDQLNVFTDNIAVKNSATSPALPVMPFLGKGEPVNVTVVVTEPYAAAATLTVGVQEADTELGPYTVLATYTFPGINKAGATLTFPLPKSLKKKLVALVYTVTGTTTTGKLFAAVTRDTLQPYEAGQYIKNGKVVA